MFIPLSWLPALILTAVIVYWMIRDLEGDGGMLSGIGCLMLLGPLGFVWAIHFLVHWFMGW